MQSQSKHTNWYHLFLWSDIDYAAHKTQWSPTEVAKALKHSNSIIYKLINKGTIAKSIDSETKQGWSTATKKNVKHRHTLAGSGQQGVLTKYPDIVKEVKTQLQGLHTVGLAMSVLIAHLIMLAIIQHQAPDLLIKFKCSEVSVIT